MNTENLGYAAINGDAANLREKTILVLGVGRGGTSMTAGVLSKLGVYMGDGLNSRYQDSMLLDCINRNNKKEARKIIEQRNDQFPVWGVKKLRLWRWDHLFRAPVYVVVFRDLVATANRRAHLFGVPVWPEMAKALFQQMMLLLFIKLSKRPIFIASYEKALLYPEQLAQGLVSFLGLKVSDHELKAAIDFINPSPIDYTQSPVNYRTAQQTRQLVGYIDQIQPGSVAGWGLSTQHHTPVMLALFIDGQKQQTLTANLPRPDVAKVDNRFHGQCGFEFKLDDTPLKGGEQIDIRFVGTDEALLNSPQKFLTGL